MFRFNPSEDVSGFNQAKSSVVKGIKARLVGQYPPLEEYIDDIIPKKEPVNIMKWWVRFSYFTPIPPKDTYVIVKPQVQGMYRNTRVQDAIRTRGRSPRFLIAFCTSGFPGTARGYCGLTIL